MRRVCAVFGGSRGIGRAVAQLLAQKGYRLAVVARNLEAARAAAGALGGDHLAFSCDVAKEHEVQSTFEEIEKNLGRVNFLVNAAGINRDSLLVRTETEDMISQLHTNLLGSMLTCKAAVKSMIQQQRGSIVNVGSVIGLKGNSGQTVYSASKGGLVGFSRALAKEVARKKIRVNVVAPVYWFRLKTIKSGQSQLNQSSWCRITCSQESVFAEMPSQHLEPSTFYSERWSARDASPAQLPPRDRSPETRDEHQQPVAKGTSAETISEKEQGSLSPEPPTVSEDWHLPPPPRPRGQSRRAGEQER
ncbi:3-oxoacyl-[acyl-carrier-protein] reductase isoform X2 [Manis javanica]|uniref:3-oxoacyl-[acyl-carrier-protein] reductase isoform X2 n=1 Tax=Manis javanica TaxID=9974 RepID=UPI003C6D8DBC